MNPSLRFSEHESLMLGPLKTRFENIASAQILRSELESMPRIVSSRGTTHEKKWGKGPKNPATCE